MDLRFPQLIRQLVEMSFRRWISLFEHFDRDRLGAVPTCFQLKQVS